MEQQNDEWTWDLLWLAAGILLLPGIPVAVAMYFVTRIHGWKVATIATGALAVLSAIILLCYGPVNWLILYTGVTVNLLVATYRHNYSGVQWWVLLGSIVVLAPLPGAGAILIAVKQPGIWLGKAKNVRPKRDKRTLRKLDELAKTAHPNDGVIMGISQETGQSVTIMDSEYNQGALIVGTPGHGKSVTLLNPIESAIQRHLPCVAVDGKGDRAWAEQIRKLCRDHKRKFYLFSTDDPHSCHWNPMSTGGVTELTDKLLSLTDWSEQHYKLSSAAFLQAVFSVFEALGIRPDLVQTAGYLNPDAAVALANKIKDTELRTKLVSELNLDRDERKAVMGLAKRVAVLTSSELRQLFQSEVDYEGWKMAETNNDTPDLDVLLGMKTPTAAIGKLERVKLHDPGVIELTREMIATIDLNQIVRERAVALFSLNSLKYRDFSEMIGRLVVNDLKTLIARRYGKSEGRDYMYIVLDEYSVFASEASVDILAMARGAGCCTIIATQSLSDLDRIDRNLAGRITDTTNTYVIQKTNNPENAERLASLAGTFQSYAKTYQTDGLWLPTETGRGSCRETREFRVHPDSIKELDRGEAFLVRKASGQHEVQRIWVRKPDI